jgi:hypothetical protein
MFGKHHLFKLAAATALAASVAVVGARTAKAGTPYNPGAYVYGGASHQVAQASQDAGFRALRSISSARQQKVATQSFRFITDTLGGNGQPKATQVRSKVESVRMIPDILGGDGHPQLPLRTLLGGNGRAVA